MNSSKSASEPEESPAVGTGSENDLSSELTTEVVRPPYFQWFGWALLLLIVGTLIANSVTSWLKQETVEGTDYSQMRTALYVAFATDMRNTLGNQGGDASGAAAQTASDQFKKALTPLRVSLLEEAPKDAEAARLLLVIDRELERPAEATALATLKESKSESDRAFADLYDDPMADGDLALAMTAEEGFTRTLVGIQAREARGEAGVREANLPHTRFLITFLFFGIMATGVCLGVFVAAYVLYLIGTGKLALGYGPLRARDAEEAGHLAFRTAIYLVILMFGGTLLGMALSSLNLSEAIETLVSSLGIIALILIMVKLPLGLDAIRVRSLFGETKPLGKLIGLGVVGFLANIPFAIILALIGVQMAKGLPQPSHPIQEMLGPGAAVATMVSLFVTAAILAPISEEIAFRSLLLGALRHRFAPLGAALINGLIFASIHPQGPALWLALMSVGTASSLLALHTRSIIPSIVLHGCHNGSIMILAFLTVG